MDLDDTPEEAAFRAEARAWLSAQAEPLAPDEARAAISEFDDPEEIERSRSWQARKADAGWACITWPVEYGGRGGTSMQSTIFRQEEARFRTPPDVFTAGIGMAGPTLLAHGTDEQKGRWLPGMARGEQIWCQLFSEPGAGSDLAALRTVAVRDGDEWVVDGQKLWSSAANLADWGLLLVRTDPDVGKHAGLTYLLVDMHTPGIDARPIRQITGGANFNEVFLSEVRAPDSHRVGEVGHGWSVALTTLMNERSSLGEGGSGGALGVRALIALATATHDERGPLLEDDAVCEAIADCYVRSKGVVYTGLRTLTAASRGVSAGSEGSIAKLVAGRMRQQMMALALDLQDLFGAVVETEPDADHLPWDHGYLFAPAARIGGGTDEVLRNIIGERVLGLPPEPRTDKGLAFREIPDRAGVNFDFDDDHRELARTARALLDDHCSLRDVRAVFEGAEPYDVDLWAAGAAMGWMGLAVPEVHGGLGLGYLEVALLAEELGRALAPIPLSSSVYLGTEALLLAGTPDQQARYLPRLASGELIATLAVQERRDRVGIADLATSVDGGRLHGVKAPVPDGEVAGLAVVVANGGSTLALVELDGDGVRREPLGSLDPSRSLARLHFDGAPAELLGAEGDGQELLRHLYDRAAVLFAFEQLGGAQRCLDLAVAYAKERYTFGRPIGSYQAVKHKLADVYVAVELARSNAYYGAWALSTGSDQLGVAACLARISATEAFQAAAEEGLHVHGGIGFTWEHDAHLFLRRSRLLAGELGAARRWKRTLVHRLAARG